MRDRIIDKQPRSEQDDAGKDQAFRRRRPHEADQRFCHTNRGRKQFIDRASETRHIDAKAGVRSRFAQQGQHQQPGNDEGSIFDPAQIRHAIADRCAEHDEIERSREHGRKDRLEGSAESTHHLAFED